MENIVILLVDDNADNLDLLRSAIKRIKNFQITTLIATDGESALDIIDHSKPHLALLDVMMPGLNGFEVCRRIRERFDLDALPIIFVTAKDDDIDLGFEVGGNDYIVKPISTAEVLARTEHQIKLIMLTNKLREANLTLENKVRERTAELAVANRQLREEIRERRYMQDRLTYLATHDFITHLFNRNSLDDAVTHALGRVLNFDELASFLVLDLDRFRVINETCGCFAGDELLRQFAELVAGHLQANDVFARLGGDKFAILSRGSDVARARDLAQTIHQQLETFNFEWEQQSFQLKVAIAVVGLGPDSISFDNLMLLADETLYHLKKQGTGTLAYDDAAEAITVNRNSKGWAVKLMDSLQQDRFRVYAQQIVHLGRDGRAHRPKLEVLARIWDVAQERLIYPDEFIKVAERFNLIVEVDKWMINATLRTLADFAHYRDCLSSICINLSALSVRDNGVFNFIKDMIERYAIPPSMLCFELTETEAVINMETAAHFVTSLHELGCQFALDDFGSGFCSFNYLKALPFDYVKIDGMFIKDMHRNETYRTMVKSIVDIARQMEKIVVAEYVESESVVADINAMNIDWAQGFHFHKPEPIDEVLQQLLHRN